MANAPRDDNYVPTLIAVSNADGVTPVVLWADPTTHRLLVDSSGSGANTALSNLAAVAINTALLPGTSDSIALGSATKMWSDLFLGDGAVINFNNGDVTLTHSSNALTLAGGQFLLPNGSVASPSFAFASDTNNGLYLLSADRPAMSAGGSLVMGWENALITSYVGFRLNTGQYIDFNGDGRIYGSTSEASVEQRNGATQQIFRVYNTYTNSTNYERLAITGVAGASLNITAETAGTGGDNLDIVLTPAGTGFLKSATTFAPTASDGAALGTTTLMFSDVFLANGAVINFNNGDVTLTHSADTLTLGGGNLAIGANNLTMTGSLAATDARVTKGWFTDIESTNMPTVGGTAILTSLTAPQFTTIELGAASDTTLSRVSAGVVAIEGVNILTVAGGLLTGSITLGENTGIAYDPAGSADGKWSGQTIAATAGYTQAFGDLVYLDPTDSRWEAADANAAAAADGDARGLLGMVVVAGTDGGACTILLMGTIRADANFPALTIGAPVYVAETAGDIVVTQPTTADVVIRIVGHALTADEIFFKPDNTWTTHT